MESDGDGKAQEKIVRLARLHQERKTKVAEITGLLPVVAALVGKYAAGISGQVIHKWNSSMKKDISHMAYDEREGLVYLCLKTTDTDPFQVSVRPLSILYLLQVLGCVMFSGRGRIGRIYYLVQLVGIVCIIVNESDDLYVNSKLIQ